uniref:Rhipicephalus family xi n=1 Tax=Rhipicephalus appendiculatus TaxID=34631 RepID=A0A131YTY0_RHIAP
MINCYKKRMELWPSPGPGGQRNSATMKSSGFATLLVSLTAFSGFKSSKGEWQPSYAYSNALGADDGSGIKFGPLRFVLRAGNQYGNDRGGSALSSGSRYDVSPYGLPGEIARRLGDNDEYSSSDGDEYGRIRRLSRRRVIVIVVRRRRPRSEYGSGSVEDGDGWIRQGGDRSSEDQYARERHSERGALLKALLRKILLAAVRARLAREEREQRQYNNREREQEWSRSESSRWLGTPFSEGSVFGNSDTSAAQEGRSNTGGLGLGGRGFLLRLRGPSTADRVLRGLAGSPGTNVAQGDLASEIPGPAELRTFGRGGDGEPPRAIIGPIGHGPIMLFRNQHTGEQASPFIGTYPSISGPSEGAGSASVEQIFGPRGLQVNAGSPNEEQSQSLYPNVRAPFGNAQGLQSGFVGGGPYASRGGPMVLLRLRRTAPESTEGSGDRESYSSGYGGPSVDTYGVGPGLGGMTEGLSGRNLGVTPAFSGNYDSITTGNIGAGMPASYQQGPQLPEQKS